MAELAHTTNPPPPTRRNLFGHVAGATAALAVLGTATASPLPIGWRQVDTSVDDGPDAALLAACDAFHAAHRHFLACNDVGNDITDEEADEISDRRYELLMSLRGMPATTAFGLAAKARVARTAMVHDAVQQLHDTFADVAAAHDLVAVSVFDDALALAGEAVA